MDVGRDAWWPGGLTLAVLSLLITWVSRQTKEPGMRAVAASFALVAVLYLGKNWALRGYEHATVFGICLAAAASVLLLVGVCQYTSEQAHSVWPRCLQIAVALLIATVAIQQSELLAPISDYVSTALLMLLLCMLSLRAALREPNHGFGVMAVAFLLHPIMVVVVYVHELDPVRVRLVTWIPFCVAGMTLLVVAQLRARERMCRELRARVHAEAALRAANETLEDEVRRRTAELKGMVDGLKSFSRMVSHDLRGPLAGIAGLAELALRAAKQGDQARLLELLGHISRQGRSSGELVTSLLTLADAGDGALYVRPTDLNACVQRAVEQVRLTRSEAPRVIWSLRKLPLVMADARLVEQVFVNLIANAVKFSAGAEKPEVVVDCIVFDGVPVFLVRDNGVGLHPSSSKLFQPFARLHGAAFEGHGIGLTVVHRIVERHGGRVWCESELGKGAAFFFTLGDEAASPFVPQEVETTGGGDIGGVLVR